MKTFESFVSQNIGVILGILGGTCVAGPFGATIGAVGGLYTSEWLDQILTCECSPLQSSKNFTTVSAGMFAAIFVTFIAYFLYQPLLLLINTLSLN